MLFIPINAVKMPLMKNSLNGGLALVAKVDETSVAALKLPRLGWPQRVSAPIFSMLSQPKTDSGPILEVLDADPSFDDAWVFSLAIGEHDCRCPEHGKRDSEHASRHRDLSVSSRLPVCCHSHALAHGRDSARFPTHSNVPRKPCDPARPPGY